MGLAFQQILQFSPEISQRMATLWVNRLFGMLWDASKNRLCATAREGTLMRQVTWLGILGLGFVIVTAPLEALALDITGMAAMGASETQGLDYMGSWVPWLANLRGVNFGGATDPYNVAIGGATSVTLLNPQHQDTQVKNFVTAGEVNIASLSIGGNDYGGNALNLLNGNVDPVVLGNQVVANISTAVDNVLSAHPDGMIVWSVPDMSLTAQGQIYVTTPALKALAAQIMADVNPQLEAAMLSRHVVYLDLASAMHDLEASTLVVGGVTIDTKNASTDPTHLWQNSIHPGTVGNGLFANLAIAALDIGYGQHIPYFTDQEILAQAGLSASYTGQTTNIDYSRYIVTAAVPEPGSFALVTGGLLVALIHRRFRRTRAQ
jgi:hypothetical protein